MPIEDTQHTEFYELVEASPELKARYDQATGEAQHAARELGADISQEEATELHSVRVATLRVIEKGDKMTNRYQQGNTRVAEAWVA